MEDNHRYDISETCKELDQRLIEYIESEYLGKNDELREACRESIKEPGVIFQTPYLEVSQSYSIKENAITNSQKIPHYCKTVLTKMSDKNLGVFQDPYLHQVESLESFFNNSDIFVSTGTGSGKTECFLWPMISKLVQEAAESKSWNTEGIRAIMMYPMNALVSDQLGRLRKMIGNSTFHDIFRTETKQQRIPKFGMYTGRTLYPGDWDKKQNKEFANTLEKDILGKNQEFQQKLKEIGRYPSKNNLNTYVEQLKSGIRSVDPNDSELLLRYEMQDVCPDILITNYSMLELMLLRPIEESIWNKTANWLSKDPHNKLLFIIDEAHMYRGSAGGEVALLVRRVLNRLNITRDRVQFILTSASVPEGELDSVLEFANALSSGNPSKNTFELIRGHPVQLPDYGQYDIDPNSLINYDQKSLRDDETVCLGIKEFCNKVGIKTNENMFSDLESISHWMYDQLSKCNQIIAIQRLCRGHARKYQDVAKLVFPNTEHTIAQHALDCIIAIAQLSKNSKEQVLLPTRLHLFFRGLPGIYACINPSCTEKTDNVPNLGKIYLEPQSGPCKCGGQIFEILNERSCGGLFIKGYMDLELNSGIFVWNNAGLASPSIVKQVNFAIGTNDNTNYVNVMVNSKTGQLFTNSAHENDPNFIKLFFNPKTYESHPDEQTFWDCPYCGHNRMNATDFATKGNDPFFNIVSKQLSIQPPTLFAEPEIKRTPNKGRKVLLFSDSRKNAALLAKQLSDLSTKECMRAAICLAAYNIQKWGEDTGNKINLEFIYPGLLKIFYDLSLNLFVNDAQRTIENDLEKYKEDLESDEPDYDEITPTIPDRIKIDLLNHICAQYSNLTDLATCWLEPRKGFFKNVKWDIIGEDNKEEVIALYSVWANHIVKNGFSLNLFKYNIKDELERDFPRYGIPGTEDILKDYVKMLQMSGYTEDAIDEIRRAFLKTMTLDEDNYRFIDVKNVQLKCDLNREWYKCSICRSVLPFTIRGKCGECGSEKVNPIIDFSNINFLRKPIVEVIQKKNYDPLRIINVEEHTAQLSHKDQTQQMWATTEDFELRFQNIYTGDLKPIDVLSCTTTMEVGIDIGSLIAIGLRNVPPSRENYQQRAGRAGRRGASISTIVTYSDKGRYDNYYFENPDEIVSGNPRIPFIDYKNRKLAIRHAIISLLAEFFRYNNNEKGSVDKIDIYTYLDEYSFSFVNYVKSRIIELNSGQSNPILPENLSHLLLEQDFNNEIIERIESFNDKYNEQKEELGFISLLDAAHDEGLIPTYSFPRNIVKFNIFNNKIESNRKITLKEAPDRQLDLALSEYVPGSELYVNKHKYISGAIAAVNETTGQKIPISKIFNDNNCRQIIKRCKNSSCGWFGFRDDDFCPFCGSETIPNQFLTPHGFAPLRPESRITEQKQIFKFSRAKPPCYSTMPTSTDDMVTFSDNLHYEKRSSQKLIVMNTGKNDKGFTICPNCGASVNGDEMTFKSVKPDSPFPNEYCKHENPISNIMLGYEFLTDLVVFEIKLDSKKINSDRDTMWLNIAARSLSEALCLAAGKVLDAESNDLKSGFRIITEHKRDVVELFLYDSLSSGAGYSSEIANNVDILMKETVKILENCSCSHACLKCLKNYSNKHYHDLLDRHAALDLLKWAISGELHPPFTKEEQKTIIQPLEDMVNKDLSNVYVYPSCWSLNKAKEFGKIQLSKFEIEQQMPFAYSKLLKELNKD